MFLTYMLLQVSHITKDLSTQPVYSPSPRAFHIAQKNNDDKIAWNILVALK